MRSKTVAKGKEKDPARFRRVFGNHWMPVALLLAGCLSLVMLLWTDRINARQRWVLGVCDAVMDIRIASGAFHLGMEEVIYQDTSVDLGEAYGKIDLAIRLAKAVIDGGMDEHGQPIQRPKDQTLRNRMEDLRLLLVRFRGIAEERLGGQNLQQNATVLNQRFHETYKEIQRKSGELEADLERDHIRSQAQIGRLFTAIIFAWAVAMAGATTGFWNRETRRRRAEEALARANDQLEIQVEKRTEELRTVNDQLRTELIERTKAEEELKKSKKQLGYLSSQLLSAQEKERKRIAQELHDELGGALGLLGIEFTLMERGLSEDQKELKERCRRDIGYIAQVADNVSRIARNLSPYLLEDLGLSASLRSLLDDFSKRSNVSVTFNIPEMDDLFSPDVEIAIYRTVQESLTNIGKHAGARHVSMTVGLCDDSIHFSIEDDGKGFSVGQALGKDPREKGMGLGTMRERMRILGGSVDIRSEKGRGSRITLRIPKNMGGMCS